MTTHELIYSVKAEAHRLLNLIAQRDCNNEVCKGYTFPHRSFYRILPEQMRLRHAEICRRNSTNGIE